MAQQSLNDVDPASSDSLVSFERLLLNSLSVETRTIR